MTSDKAFFGEYTDAAKRISDEMTMHTLNSQAGCWAVFRLSDGTPVDHTPYPDWSTAVRIAGKWDRDNYVYIQVTPDGMTPKAAQAWLNWQRFLHKMGWRIPSPDFDYDTSMPTYSWDKLNYARHLVSGGKFK